MNKKETVTVKPENTVDITDEIKAGEAVSASTATQVADKDKLVVALNFPRAIDFTIGRETDNERTLTFYGNAEALKGQAQGVLPEAGTYGLTPNVDRKDWEDFMKEYGDSPLVKKELLFATTPDKVRNMVAEHNYTRNGFEPIRFEEQQ